MESPALAIHAGLTQSVANLSQRERRPPLAGEGRARSGVLYIC